MSPFVFSTADEDNSTPSKRTCRSLSIPNDGELRNKWMQRNRLHRPLAVRPLSGGARSKGRSHGRLSVGLYDRASPDSPHSRPSSASSGFFDSPHISSSNLNKKRCESLHTLPTFDFEPNINFTNIVQVCKSMPSVADCSQGNSHRLERCLSQPCVSKRTGVKRRIDDVFKRPSINFSKQMAEVSGPESIITALISAGVTSGCTSHLPLAISTYSMTLLATHCHMALSEPLGSIEGLGSASFNMTHSAFTIVLWPSS